MVQNDKLFDLVYHLARLSLAGNRPEILMQIRRIGRRLRHDHPDIAERLEALLSEQPTLASPVRSASAAGVPIDADSRLQLARVQFPVDFDVEPIWADAVLRPLEQVVAERSKEDALREAGLMPTRSMLFVGPPGVGKTLAASWLARALKRPLMTLDLAAVMNRFLGRTGGNIRQVLDYAKGVDCVLLLDELDAVAKRRDDDSELGELKRLVTVLIQEIDSWPSTGVLLAATNHPDLLDPAVWRRFDMVVEFPLPNAGQVRTHVAAILGPEVKGPIVEAVAIAFCGRSFSDIERDLLRARREAIVTGHSVEERVAGALAEWSKGLPHAQQVRLAGALVRSGLSQRKASELTGIHRNTIKKTVGLHHIDDQQREDRDDA